MSWSYFEGNRSRLRRNQIWWRKHFGNFKVMRSEVKKTDSLSDEGITFNVEDDLGSGFFWIS